ncbi:MAG: hypothetical protein GVY16_05680 [Planctomycetes bacterium]|jgi:DNA polymerase-4|nr:hypothetical protein [Planctomycetota bacterium]
MHACGTSRLILHVDIDAFFASVEQLLIPFLRRRPVIVGSGVIASCSDEARRFGCRAGMELHRAKRLCPSAVILPGRQSIYRCFAEAVWEITRRYATRLETYLDEAYGEATGMDRLHGTARDLGESLRTAVAHEIGLPVSVGLACNRMLAKMASGSAKPGGTAVIEPGDEAGYLADLPARKLPGVGSKTETVLDDINAHTVGQMRRLSLAYLREAFGRRGEVLYERCRGRDVQDLPAEGPTGTPPPKRISRETTFHAPTCDRRKIDGMLHHLLERAMLTARREGLNVGRLELHIRYDDCKQRGASASLQPPTQNDADAWQVLSTLLARLHTRRVALRHVGVALDRLAPAVDMPLFEAAPAARDRRLRQAVDAIRDRYGHAAVVTGRSIDLRGTLERNEDAHANGPTAAAIDF